MLPTVWNAEAIEDVERTIDYIDEQNPAAALKVRERLVETAVNLGHFPTCIGRVG